MEKDKEFIGNAKVEQLTNEEMEAVAGGSGYKLKFDIPTSETIPAQLYVAGGSDYKLRITLSEEQMKIIEDRKNRPVVWKAEN